MNIFDYNFSSLLFLTVLADYIINCGIFLFLMSYDNITSQFCLQELQHTNEMIPNKDIFILFRDKNVKEKHCESLMGKET